MSQEHGHNHWGDDHCRADNGEDVRCYPLHKAFPFHKCQSELLEQVQQHHERPAEPR